MKKYILSTEPISILIRCFLFSLLLSSCMATQQDILTLNRQMQTLSSQVQKLEGLRERQADAGAEIESVQRELQRLAGTLEENQHLLKDAVERDTLAQDTMNARMALLEKKVEQISKQLNLESLPEPQGTAPEVPPYMPDVKNPQTFERDDAAELPEKALYDKTLAIYHEGKYNDAIAGFENLIKTYPDSDLADNAQYWIGEAYMALKQYETAIQAYNEVITKYPKGNKVPNAMLKQALAFVEAKDEVAAKIVLKNLIRKYPGSEETKLAEAKLKTLK